MGGNAGDAVAQPWWLAIAVAVIGAAAVLLGPRVRDVLDERRRREAFQHETLRSLQEAASALVESASAIYVEMMRLYDEATTEQQLVGQVPTTDLFREQRQRYRAALEQVKTLGVRVEDESVRQDLNRLLRLGDSLAFDPPNWHRMAKPGHPDPLQEIGKVGIRVNRRIGELLRGVPPTVAKKTKVSLSNWWRRKGTTTGH